MPMLSKSRLLSSLQCAKRVWLEVHRPELREDSSATAASFAAGHEVGAVARRIYDPEGVGTVLDVGAAGVSALLARTRELIGQPRPLFEAGFATGSFADGALALADVLLPDAQDGWRMVEVKSSTEVKDYHRQDAAIQYYIATQARVPVSRVAVAHIDNGWTYPGNGDYAGLLREEDLTEQVRALQPQVPGWIAAAHAAVATATEPATTMGAQCSKPYDCGFRAHCERQAEAVHGPVEFPVHWLPRPGKQLKEHIAAHGVRSLADVPDALLSQQQLRVKQVTLQGEPFFDRAGAANALKQHGLPAYFLDFETISFAVPVWAGTRPFQQIPFQYSLHVLGEDGDLKHEGFLDLAGGDPSLALARSLVGACGSAGPVYAYNAGFEAGVIRDLAQRFPDLGPALLAIEQRLVDLLPVARDHFYHPSQQGSWSIKRVLPALVPELRYSDLEGVQDGGKAQQAYVEAIAGATREERRQQLHAQLWAYCRLDTLAMVELWREFLGREMQGRSWMKDPRQWALLQAAHQFIEGGRIFEAATGYAPEKAREVFVCAVVNLWLEKVGDSRRIEPATAPRGFDGTVPGLPPGAPNGVEIKTRRTGSEFIFPYKFLPSTSSFWTDHPGLGFENGERLQDHFRRHQFVLLANHREIWVACGPAVMEELARELDAETRRTSFRPLDGHEPKLFLTPRPIKGVRLAASRGMTALQAQYGGYAAGKSDWVETICLPSFCSALGLR